MLLLWNHKWKPVPLRLAAAPIGHADCAVVREEIEGVRSIRHEQNVIIHFMTIDGDRGDSVLHKKRFGTWTLVLHTEGFDEAVRFVRSQTGCPILDFSYLTKCFKIKVVLHPMLLHRGRPDSTITAELMNRLLRLQDVLADHSRVEAMRNAYQIKLFAKLYVSPNTG
jgi:hypothetical protein